MKPIGYLLLPTVFLLAVACQSQPAASQRTAAVAPAAPVGGYAIPRRDVSVNAVLAEASRTGRPALLYFWTSW